MYVKYIEEQKFIITFVQHYKFVSMSKIISLFNIFNNSYIE